LHSRPRTFGDRIRSVDNGRCSPAFRPTENAASGHTSWNHSVAYPFAWMGPFFSSASLSGGISGTFRSGSPSLRLIQTERNGRSDYRAVCNYLGAWVARSSQQLRPGPSIFAPDDRCFGNSGDLKRELGASSASFVRIFNVTVSACDVTTSACCFVVRCLTWKDVAKTGYPLADQFVTSKEAALCPDLV
jgi:hypothetical protein